MYGDGINVWIEFPVCHPHLEIYNVKNKNCFDSEENWDWGQDHCEMCIILTKFTPKIIVQQLLGYIPKKEIDLTEDEFN